MPLDDRANNSGGELVQDGAWLTIIIGAAAVIGIVLLTPVLRELRPSRRRRSAVGRGGEKAPSAARRRRSASPVSALVPRRRSRSVEDNFRRAAERIDAVDPYAAARRIGSALADIGLVSEAPSVSGADGRVDTGPSGRTERRSAGEDRQ